MAYEKARELLETQSNRIDGHQDNGINFAYLYNVRASICEGPDAITDFVLAQRTRRRVVNICQALLEQIKKTKDTLKRFDRDAT